MTASPGRVDYDVVVVGGGPAGSAAARRLGRAGVRVAVLESHRFPRLKPCGNLVSHFARSHLEFDLPPGIVRGEARGAVVSFGSHVARILTPPFGVFCFRTDLDHFLIDRAVDAGAELRDATTVCGVTIEGTAGVPRVRLSTRNGSTLTAHYVIGADGANSVVARYVRRRPLGRYERAVGLMELRPTPATGWKPEDDGLLFIDLNASRTGYGWVFPQGTHQNIGVAGWAPFFRHAKAAFATFASRLPDGGPRQQHGHLIPVGVFRYRIARGPLLLTGDAAGLLNLASGEGIGYAIASGQLAGDAIVRALAAPHAHADAAQRYTHLVRSSIAKELRAASCLAALILATRRLHFALEPTDADAIFGRLFAAVAGTTTYANLARFVFSHLPLYVAKWAWHSAGRSLSARVRPGTVGHGPSF